MLAFGAKPESTLHTYFPSFLSRATPNCPPEMKKEVSSPSLPRVQLHLVSSMDVPWFCSSLHSHLRPTLVLSQASMGLRGGRVVSGGLSLVHKICKLMLQLRNHTYPMTASGVLTVSGVLTSSLSLHDRHVVTRSPSPPFHHHHPLSCSVQLLSSLTQCLTTDPLSSSVWKQLYPKHLSQSRQVGVGSPLLVYTEKPPSVCFQTRAGVSYQKHQSLFSRLPPLRSVKTQLGGLKELLWVGPFRTQNPGSWWQREEAGPVGC